MLDSKELKVQHKNMNKFWVRVNARMLSMLIIIIEGRRMAFIIMNSINILEEHQNVDDDHNTFVARIYEEVIDRR